MVYFCKLKRFQHEFEKNWRELGIIFKILFLYGNQLMKIMELGGSWGKLDIYPAARLYMSGGRNVEMVSELLWSQRKSLFSKYSWNMATIGGARLGTTKKNYTL